MQKWTLNDEPITRDENDAPGVWHLTDGTPIQLPADILSAPASFK
jgi:hypothetical protein